MYSPCMVQVQFKYSPCTVHAQFMYSSNKVLVQFNPFVVCTPIYDEYYEYLLGYAKKLEAAVAKNNTPSRKANLAESDYFKPYSPSDSCYSNATNLLTYMSDQGDDLDMIQDMLQCHQAMKEGRPRPPARTRREPLRQDLRI